MSKMKTLYLVSQINYEYNDEVYYTYNSDAVLPLQLYTSESKAREVAVAKTLEYIDDLELYCYGYDISDVFDTDILEQLADKYGVEYLEDDGYGEVTDGVFHLLLKKGKNEMNQELVDTLINDVLQISFYKVQEVEVSDK